MRVSGGAGLPGGGSLLTGPAPQRKKANVVGTVSSVLARSLEKDSARCAPLPSPETGPDGSGLSPALGLGPVTDLFPQFPQL